MSTSVDPNLPALSEEYGALTGIVDSLSEEEAWLPTGCLGFHVRDLVMHMLGDARRALVALSTPSAVAPDRDAVTYWSDSPGADDPECRGLRSQRILASAYSLTALRREWRETTAAVVYRAEHSDLDEALATQGHTLRAGDLVSTLVVEAAIHHLDLVKYLDRPGPSAGPLSVVRRTLDGLLGRPAPAHWDDATYALSATGRRHLTAEDRAALGDRVTGLPLIS